MQKCKTISCTSRFSGVWAIVTKEDKKLSTFHKLENRKLRAFVDPMEVITGVSALNLNF